MISIKDPSSHMNALHIDGRFRNSVQIDLSVGKLIGGSETNAPFVGRKNGNVCILCDGLQLCAVSADDSPQIGGDGRRQHYGIDWWANRRTALSRGIDCRRNKVVAMNSEEFDRI